jgi:predicted restriction endonuclease
MNGLQEDDLPKDGLERETIVKVRVNQRFFRTTVLTSYSSRCCITGLGIPILLSASHIAPWATDPNNRMNPRNGLCLNLLHHKAFDAGLITITPEFRVRISASLATSITSDANKFFFTQYDNQFAQLPRRFLPDPSLLKWHNQNIFVP